MFVRPSMGPKVATVTGEASLRTAGDPLAPGTSGRRHWGGPVIGGFYLSMGGVHLGLVAADVETYRHFADAGLFAFVRDGWQQIFMAYPAVFGLLLMAGETVLGILLLRGGRPASLGWAGAVLFHLLLMLFGFGIWAWCLPALALLIYLARRDDSVRWGSAASEHSDASARSLASRGVT
jgi:hypothetical protein